MVLCHTLADGKVHARWEKHVQHLDRVSAQAGEGTANIPDVTEVLCTYIEEQQDGTIGYSVASPQNLVLPILKTHCYVDEMERTCISSRHWVVMDRTVHNAQQLGFTLRH